MRSFRNNRGGSAGNKGAKGGFILRALSVLALLVSGCAWHAAGAEDDSKGRAALRSGQYASAKEYFAKLETAESKVCLLQVLRETGAYSEALQRALEFLSKWKGSPALLLEQGRLLKENGDYQNAEKSLRQSVELAPSGSTLRMQASRELGDLLEATGRRDEASAVWDQILDRYRAGGVRGSQGLGAVAVAAWRRGYERDARDIFMDATDEKVGEVALEVLADFGDLFLEKYNPREASGVFRDCLKINRFYARALLGLALAKKYDSNFEVEANARAALQVNPKLAGAWTALAQVSLEQEDDSAALRHADSALSANPADVEALAVQAFCRYVRNDSAGFAKIEKQVLDVNPYCGRFYYLLAENLASRRKYGEAVKWSQRAVALEPDLWPAYTTLGMNLTRIGDLEGGRKAIEQAFDGDGYNVWASNSLDLFNQMGAFARSRSEHFLFLMDTEDAPGLSTYVPELAEEVYEKLTRRYGFTPEGPLSVELFPDHEGFAVRTLGLPGLAGALGVCFGKVIAMNSPHARERGSFNWGSTLWHEFAHVISLQMTNHNIPRWFSEGISVYEEHRARPGWGDPLTGAFLQAYQSGKLMKASELNAGFVRPQSPGQIMVAYYQAGLACEMIEELYGFEKIRESLLLFAKNLSAEEVFLRTLGLDKVQMDAAYAKFLDSRFRKLSANVRFANPGAEERPGVIEVASDKAALMKRIEKAPDDFGANLQLGRMLRKERSNTEAERYLKRAQEVFPQYTEEGNPYEILSEIYLELKREDDALAQYRAWSRMDGNSLDPLLKAAEIYGNRKDWSSAATVLGLSVFIDPYSQDVHRKLGEAAMSSGNWPAAVVSYRALVGLNPTDMAGARYHLARALSAAGQKQEARREILRSLEIAPTYREALQFLLQLSGTANEN